MRNQEGQSMLRLQLHTADLGLQIDGHQPLQLQTFVDASYGGTADDSGPLEDTS